MVTGTSRGGGQGAGAHPPPPRPACSSPASGPTPTSHPDGTRGTVNTCTCSSSQNDTVCPRHSRRGLSGGRLLETPLGALAGLGGPPGGRVPRSRAGRDLTLQGLWTPGCPGQGPSLGSPKASWEIGKGRYRDPQPLLEAHGDPARRTSSHAAPERRKRKGPKRPTAEGQGLPGC